MENLPVNRAVKLSRRELEVLNLIGSGYTSKEVADVLFVSKRTVDFHLSNVYEKLMVSNRIQAVRTASRLGLVPFEPITISVSKPRPRSPRILHVRRTPHYAH